MMKTGRKRTVLKVIVGFVVLLLLVLVAAYFYVSSVAGGSEVGKLPAGYSLVEANGYRFSTKISGDKNDTPVILLHGFPESSVMWKRLMADLNEQGYYTIAPDQRGYSYKARPEDIEQYKIDSLASDVIALANELGLEKFHLVTHDWGAGVGWKVAADYPERLHSFTSLSVPHLAAFSRAYREDTAQYNASDYIRNFQTAKMPEFMLGKNDYKLLRSLWKDHTEEDKEAYVELLSQKNALTSAINWYRANFNIFDEGFKTPKIEVPVLFIWGNQDKAIKRSGIDWNKECINGYYKFVEVEAGHWLIQEDYDEVQAEIVAHLEKF